MEQAGARRKNQTPYQSTMGLGRTGEYGASSAASEYMSMILSSMLYFVMALIIVISL